MALNMNRDVFITCAITGSADTTDKVKAFLPTAAENMTSALQSDAQWWADNQAVLKAKFERWLAYL